MKNLKDSISVTAQFLKLEDHYGDLMANCLVKLR